MRRANSAIKQADLGIAGTEPDGLFLGRDQLLDRAGHEFAPANMRVCMGPVPIQRDHRFVLGNGFAISMLRALHLGFREMRDSTANFRRPSLSPSIPRSTTASTRAWLPMLSALSHAWRNSGSCSRMS